MKQQEKSQTLTPNFVMNELDISRPTLNDWCRKGILRKIQIPGARRVYITKESFDKLVFAK